MKRKLFFAATAATLLFTGCANDEYVGEVENPRGELTEITFLGNKGAITRATVNGADAAGKLNSTFYVYGTKHTAAEDGTSANDKLVFNNYKVTYTSASSPTNTSGWEYVGNTLGTTNITPNIGKDEAPTPKYWDFGATNGYTFYAFSANPDDITNNKVKVKKVQEDPATTGDKSQYKKGYEIDLTADASFKDIYFSNREVVNPSDPIQVVKFSFRNIACKVRVGFYETIPGYSVKIDNMYGANSDVSNNNFIAKCANVAAAQEQELTVTYDNNNNPLVGSSLSSANTLTLGANVMSQTSLGTSSSSPTYDKENGEYTYFWPQEPDEPLKLKVNYTLTSTDGSQETIKVTGATASVPIQYVSWKSNFAYTYLFKISDNTNGSTGETGPAGLYPITFDAVVMNEIDGIQETITNVSDPSITTYSKGEIVTTKDEYKKDNDIYVVLQDANGLIAPENIGTAAKNAQIYTVTGTNITEKDIIAALNETASGITLTVYQNDESSTTIVSAVPASDGTNYTFKDSDDKDAAVKFTPNVAGTYAYVYFKTPKSAGTPGEYYVKVIKVVN